MPDEKKPASFLKIFLVLACYWVVSITMVFANKYLVGNKLSISDVAVFVAWFQCVMTVIIACLTIQFCRVVLGHDISMPSMSNEVLLNPNLMLLYFFFVGMLVCNNYCLKYVGVSFFQVARSLALIFTVILSMFLLKQKISIRIIGCCMVVVSGFILGVDQEKISGSLSVIGVIFGVVSSFFIAMNGIFIKRALIQITKNNSLYNVFYMNFGGAVLMLPLVLITKQEVNAFIVLRSDPFFLILLLITSVLGFLLSFVATLCIEVTSPTTLHVSNNTKAIVQTVIAVVAYREYKTNLWWVSIFLVITGAALYTYTRNREMAAEVAAEVEEAKDPVTESV